MSSKRSAGQGGYVQIAEFAQILKARWHLDSLGARTEELLRNGLHVLADNNLTLLEFSPLLTSAAFRAACLQRVQNTEVVSYFRTRFDTRSEAMQGAYRDAILNKISGFTTDQRFRHILGQQRSTFSLLDAMDRGRWVILNLDKGRLGEQAATLGSLLLTKLKNALFARRRRQLFTLYCDEIQNLVAYDAGLDTLLSEARKVLDLRGHRKSVPGAVSAADARRDHGHRHAHLLSAFERGCGKNRLGARWRQAPG